MITSLEKGDLAVCTGASFGMDRKYDLSLFLFLILFYQISFGLLFLLIILVLIIIAVFFEMVNVVTLTQ